MLVSVLDEQPCRVDGHRAVEEHRDVGDALGALEHMQMIEHVLRAPHSEGRNDKRAAASCRPAHHVADLLGRVFAPVQTIAVRRTRLRCSRPPVVGQVPSSRGCSGGRCRR